MSLDDSIREIARHVPQPKRSKAVYGKWVPFAWQTRGLVERQNWAVSDAIRQVIHLQHLAPADKAFKGIRSAYYGVKDRPWPTEEDV